MTDITFLKEIKRIIEDLPEKIWDNSDYDSSDYIKKRKLLLGKVMHLENKISAYVIRKYGNDSILNKEFCCYSFFPPNGTMFDTFNVANNEYWEKGKRSYLYFIDKLIDYAEIENLYTFKVLGVIIFKWVILILIALITSIIVCSNSFLPSTIITHLEGTINKGFVVILISLFTALILWPRKWTTLLPILFAVLLGFIK